MIQVQTHLNDFIPALTACCLFCLACARKERVRSVIMEHFEDYCQIWIWWLFGDFYSSQNQIQILVNGLDCCYGWVESTPTLLKLLLFSSQIQPLYWRCNICQDDLTSMHLNFHSRRDISDQLVYRDCPKKNLRSRFTGARLFLKLLLSGLTSRPERMLDHTMFLPNGTKVSAEHINLAEDRILRWFL
jgi:hypothetical protein